MLDRRAMLGLAGTSLLAALAGGCATPVPLPPEARSRPISAIRASGTANITLAQLAPMVAEALAVELGPRYVPGAKGGSTLVVQLKTVVLDDDGGGRDDFRIGFSSVDQLDGRVELLGPRGEAYASFPLLASTGQVFGSIMDIYPDPRRLMNLARTYAHWIVVKLA